MSFTPEQLQAIGKDGSLIVSAAAGAGKTTVLTERVFRLVSGGMRVEHMLVLTFTRAAAGEMKGRIGRRLREAAAAETGARALYFREQAAAVANANVSTIDAFCAKVVFRHYFRVGLTPSCRTLDETETEVLKTEAMSAALDRLAAENGDAYQTLIIAFGNEQALLEAMKDAHAFLSAQPDPAEFLDRSEAALDDEAVFRDRVATAFRADKELLARYVAELTVQRDLLPPSCEKVLTLLDDILSRARGALITDDRAAYAAQTGAIGTIGGRLTFPKDYAEEDKKGVTDAKSALLGLCREQAARNSVSVGDLFGTEREAAPVLSAFFALMRSYLELFREAKQAKNALDFADLEHMTIEILKDDEIAAEYRDRFETIIVDEYQDSNRVQETILNRIARPGSLFFVGDVKQSIYRFRMAEPSLFLEKCRDFRGDVGTRIDLGHNFRSGKAVIDAVNATFQTLMREPVAGIEYDARAMLRQGAAVPDGKTELHLFSREADPEDEESLEDAEAEARFVADTIHARMARPVVDGRNGERPCRYEDFAVLLRSKANVRAWTETLSAAGIPCYAQTAGGYFEAVEVKLFMSLLEVLSNRRQDVPLLAVLRSPLFGFTDGDLARIRCREKKVPLLDCLLHARAAEPKVDAFLAKIGSWQSLARRMPLAELLQRILDETHYRELVGVLTGGDQRTANLDALVREAAGFDASGMSGVHGFLRFMKNVRETQKLGASSTVTANVVRIMTVHAAKGLEFPFVFYAGLGGQFNRKDERKALVWHAEHGVGLRYFDAYGVKHETLTHENVVRAISDASFAEELRVLYVGMTRAKQELYLLGSTTRAEERAQETPLPTLLSIRRSSDALKLLLLALKPAIGATAHKKGEFARPPAGTETQRIPAPGERERNDLLRRLIAIRPQETGASLPDKTSVTGLDREETLRFNGPAFETGYDVLSEGSAVHRALERIPLKDAEKRAAFLADLPGVTPFHADAIRSFAASPLFLRMASSPRVEREWSFLCPTPARLLFDGVDSDEPVLLQGVIDACFLEDGAWILLDYKTDRVDGDPGSAAKKHTRQVALYAEALAKLSGIPVRERHVVLLGANTEVPV